VKVAEWESESGKNSKREEVGCLTRRKGLRSAQIKDGIRGRRAGKIFNCRETEKRFSEVRCCKGIGPRGTSYRQKKKMEGGGGGNLYFYGLVEILNEKKNPLRLGGGAGREHYQGGGMEVKGLNVTPLTKSLVLILCCQGSRKAAEKTILGKEAY